uniref:Uncharacterized protein n=1 Tax=Lepeophtheirus salmonis TaxID=72036 RepID=A0A0K2UPU9_LEPSM
MLSFQKKKNINKLNGIRHAVNAKRIWTFASCFAYGVPSTCCLFLCLSVFNYIHFKT